MARRKKPVIPDDVLDQVLAPRHERTAPSRRRGHPGGRRA